ncbi:hypothetical protein [Vibrio sp. 10N.286.49.B3]|uniref:hypothetical protein n=1 Tax=Vibrio sp. 10N.286.49.B3 TaxID=1880855 RepID=UPI0018E439EA|nr:hypothetical protein [Vibrio sp. 10N.286.49.B3]
MKVILLIVVLLQLSLAFYSEGLTRSLAELSAFVLVVGLALHKLSMKNNPSNQGK